MSLESLNPRGDKPEKSSEQLQHELSRIGWDLENERREKAVFELKQPIEKILGALHEDIEGGKISVLIGDDASGRIPTLVFKNVLTEIYKEHDQKPPETFFISGPGGGKALGKEQLEERVELIAEHLRKAKELKKIVLSPDSKVLVITEAIWTGRSVLPVVEVCKKYSLACEVVAIGLGPDKNIGEIEDFLGVKVHVGMNSTPLIYRKFSFGGVVKNNEDSFIKEADIVADRYVDKLPKDEKDRVQRWINEIRREVGVLSDEIVEWYKTENKT